MQVISTLKLMAFIDVTLLGVQCDIGVVAIDGVPCKCWPIQAVILKALGSGTADSAGGVTCPDGQVFHHHLTPRAHLSTSEFTEVMSRLENGVKCSVAGSQRQSLADTPRRLPKYSLNRHRLLNSPLNRCVGIKLVTRITGGVPNTELLIRPVTEKVWTRCLSINVIK